MDYVKLYYKLCTYCKETPLNERILKRDSNDGVKKISESKKGMIPVLVDGKVMSVSVLHPKVLNGEWTHHTTVKISVFDEFGNKL